LNPDAWLALSPWSEPLLSPVFREVVTHAVERGLKVLVETNGIGLDAGMIAFLKAFPEGAVTTVVSLDVLSGEEYARWKGADHFAKVTAAIRELAAVRPRDTYVQVLNMDELSTVIDGFYDFWADLQDRVLPRKYNSFCGRLPERSTTDLSPLTRFPCWHLKRDMVIRADGTVGLCKQDLDRAWFAGDLNKETLAAVWERLGEAFARHAGEEGWGFPGCGGCDEWHTYNF
jgi:spiro-SPASM protein